MLWKPEHNSEEPVFRQIIDYFEQTILDGTLLPGTKLPTERALAERFSVNRSTIAAAYNELRASGFIHSVQGSGTRVSEHIWGILPKRMPNWQHYNNNASFIPALPIVQRTKEARADKTMINLSTGELSEDLHPTHILNTIIRNMTISVSLHYAIDPRGDEALRHSISRHLLDQQNIYTNTDQILVTSGADHALYLITHRLLFPGDAIAMEGPSYIYSRPLFQSAGLRLFPIPMDEHGMLPDQLIPLIQKHKIRMIFTNPTFHNPTGTTLPLSRRKRLLEICEKYRIPIVEDDPYSSLTHEGTSVSPPSLKALHGDGQMVIYIGTLAKTAGPGLRTGWIVAPAEIIDRLGEAKQQMGFAANTLGEQIAAHYLDLGAWENHLKVVNQTLSKRRKILLEMLDLHASDQLSYTDPEGGFYIWCRLRQKVSDRLLVEEAIKNGLVFMPGIVFGEQQGSFRISFAPLPEDQIVEGVKKIGEMVKRFRPPAIQY